MCRGYWTLLFNANCQNSVLHNELLRDIGQLKNTFCIIINLSRVNMEDLRKRLATRKNSNVSGKWVQNQQNFYLSPSKTRWVLVLFVFYWLMVWWVLDILKSDSPEQLPLVWSKICWGHTDSKWQQMCVYLGLGR